MDDDARQQALLSALVTEHFVLQSARAVTTSEANGRASLYLTLVSGAVIALGFVAQVGEEFGAFAAAVLPALLLLGEFTYVRLLENSIEDVLLFQAIQRIRRWYLSLGPDAAEFFADARPGQVGLAMYAGNVQFLFTAASMVAAINATLVGAAVALLLRALDLVGLAPAIAVGALVAAACYAAHFRHALRRFDTLTATAAALARGGAGDPR